tara:strand:+ start:83 stop:355 length:273 start_codon:yes stop_codon:yes gene_type:complete
MWPLNLTSGAGIGFVEYIISIIVPIFSFIAATVVIVVGGGPAHLPARAVVEIVEDAIPIVIVIFDIIMATISVIVPVRLIGLNANRTAIG